MFRWLTIIPAIALPKPWEQAVRVEESLGFQSKQIRCEFQCATKWLQNLGLLSHLLYVEGFATKKWKL